MPRARSCIPVLAAYTAALALIVGGTLLGLRHVAGHLYTEYAAGEEAPEPPRIVTALEASRAIRESLAKPIVPPPLPPPAYARGKPSPQAAWAKASAKDLRHIGPRRSRSQKQKPATVANEHQRAPQQVSSHNVNVF
jgi:hypothetical protein